MFLSVFGHLNVDFIISVPRIPEEGSIFTKSTSIRAGGTARNISLVSGKLGIDVEIFSKIGRDFPEEYVKELEKNGVHTGGIIRDDRFSFSPVCFIVSDSIRQVAFIDQGPMGDDGIEFVEMPAGEWVHFGTGNPGEYVKIKEKVRGNIAFDPGQEIHYRYTKEMFSSMVENAKVLFFNRYEFERARNFMTVERMLEVAENIVVTLGGDGCVLMNRMEKVTLESYHVKAKETIGAGDSFRAGFYLGMKNNIGMKKSCLLGMKIASIVVEQGLIPDHFPDMNEIVKSL